MHTKYSRKEFFETMLLGGAGLYALPLLHSCKNKDDLDESIAINGNIPFAVWEDMANYLKDSPDNLIARRKTLIEEGDPAAMAKMVREDLAVIPTDAYYFRYIGTASLYGKKIAIRTGLATPREKAEILKEMYEEAGFKAQVIYERIDFSEEEVKNILFSQKTPIFSPPISDARYQKWTELLGVQKSDVQIHHIENIEQRASSFAEKITSGIEEKDMNISWFGDFMINNNQIPSVLVEIDGKENFAHVFDTNVAFGKLHPKNKDQNFTDADNYTETDENIEISVTAIKALQKKEEFELIKGSWKASELIGNQVKINFLNNLDFKGQISTPIQSINFHTPALSLQDMAKDAEYLGERSFLGEPIDLSGYQPLKESIIVENPNILNAETEAAVEVSTLEIKANPKIYPDASIKVYPRSVDGNIVEGLAPQNFKFFDNGKPVQAWMRQNVFAPKILIVYDTSLSMPMQFRKEGITAFLEKTEGIIREKYAYANIDLQKTGSSIYSTHLQVAQLGYDIILYATDGHNDDKFIPEQAEIYKNGTPTIYLNVYNASKDYFDQIGQNTSSEVMDALDQDLLLEKLAAFFEGMDFPPYVFNFRAMPSENIHEVKVEMNHGGIFANDEFSFPENADSATGDRIISLVLNIKCGNKKPVKRILAGWDPRYEYDKKPDRTMLNEVQDLLLGGAVIAIERECPSDSVRFSEYIQALLSTKNWFTAYQNNETEKAMEELAKGFFHYPKLLLTMMQPPVNTISKQSVTIPRGYRIGVLKFSAGLFTNKTSVNFDYLQTSDYISYTGQPSTSFKETLKKTAQFAILEDEMFQKSTLAELGGADLYSNQLIESTSKFSRDFLGKDYNYFYYQVFRSPDINLFDSSASSKSYWKIRKNSGELYGMLANQTGGGENSELFQLKELQDTIDFYERLTGIINIGMTVAGVGSVPVGLITTYSLTLVKLYALATEAVILMQSEGMEEKVKKVLRELACNIFKDLEYGVAGKAGETLSGIENIIAAMGGNHSFIKC